MNQNHLKLGGLALIVATIFIVAIVVSSGDDEVSQNTETTPPRVTEQVKLPDVPKYTVVANEYFDWQQAKGPLAESLQDYVSMPLYTLRYGEPVFASVLRTVEFSGNKAVLHLRPGIYWSDGKPLHGGHIADAVDRFRMLVASGRITVDDPTRKLSETIRITRQGNLMADVHGFSSAEELHSFLTGKWIRPVRGDLLGEFPGNPQGFLVTVGPYRFKEIKETGKLELPAAMELLPNDVFFQGPPKVSQKIDLTLIFPPKA